MQAWNEQPRAATSKRTSECIIHLRKKHRRMRLPNTITIDSIYEKKFLSVNSILEAVVLNAYPLPGGLKCVLEWFFKTSVCSPLLKFHDTSPWFFETPLGMPSWFLKYDIVNYLTVNITNQPFCLPSYFLSYYFPPSSRCFSYISFDWFHYHYSWVWGHLFFQAQTYLC